MNTPPPNPYATQLLEWMRTGGPPPPRPEHRSRWQPAESDEYQAWSWAWRQFQPEWALAQLGGESPERLLSLISGEPESVHAHLRALDPQTWDDAALKLELEDEALWFRPGAFRLAALNRPNSLASTWPARRAALWVLREYAESLSEESPIHQLGDAAWPPPLAVTPGVAHISSGEHSAPDSWAGSFWMMVLHGVTINYDGPSRASPRPLRLPTLGRSLGSFRGHWANQQFAVRLLEDGPILPKFKIPKTTAESQAAVQSLESYQAELEAQLGRPAQTLRRIRAQLGAGGAVREQLERDRQRAAALVLEGWGWPAAEDQPPSDQPPSDWPPSDWHRELAELLDVTARSCPQSLEPAHFSPAVRWISAELLRLHITGHERKRTSAPGS